MVPLYFKLNAPKLCIIPGLVELHRLPGIEPAAVSVVDLVHHPPAGPESYAVDGIHGEQHFPPESVERGEEKHRLGRRTGHQVR